MNIPDLIVSVLDTAAFFLVIPEIGSWVQRNPRWMSLAGILALGATTLTLVKPKPFCVMDTTRNVRVCINILEWFQGASWWEVRLVVWVPVMAALAGLLVYFWAVFIKWLAGKLTRPMLWIGCVIFLVAKVIAFWHRYTTGTALTP